MEMRAFGATGLRVSVVGFGAWAIGGPALAGGAPIGWGAVDEAEATRALQRALQLGINLIDTADVYGFGRSEELVGRVVGNRLDVVVATKGGQRRQGDGPLQHDYAPGYIERACEASLRRLRRDAIDFYQLHTARVEHLRDGACIEALGRLQAAGKIRHFGVSLNTYAPLPEAELLVERGWGSGVQLVLNVLNQRARPMLGRLGERGFGVIARMPLQFGLLSGKIGRETRFAEDDHRSRRLSPAVLEAVMPVLESEIWPLAAELGCTPASLALSFCASFPEVSTIIPGIRTAEQAEQNAAAVAPLPLEVRERLLRLYELRFAPALAEMEARG